jgi:hypothetical protein
MAKHRNTNKHKPMYERRGERLISNRAFLIRLARHGTAALVLVTASLVAGVLGYHWIEGLDWPDAVENAAMILGGMGPVNAMQTTAGKYFAAVYALYSGLVFIVVVGILGAPVAHRLLHHFHAEMEERDPM